MTPFAFCYWLQGYLELSEHPLTPLTGEQLYLLQEHLRLVEQPNLPFLFWLQGALEAAACDPAATVSLDKIQGRLAATFRNHIDPSYPREIQEKLYALHSRQ